MKFEYQAIDEDGSVVRGIIDAQNAEKVLQILLYLQLHPLDIRGLTDSTVELNRLNSLKQKLKGPKVSVKQPVENKQEVERTKSVNKIDWYYVFFILMILGLLATAAVKV